MTDDISYDIIRDGSATVVTLTIPKDIKILTHSSLGDQLVVMFDIRNSKAGDPVALCTQYQKATFRNPYAEYNYEQRPYGPKKAAFTEQISGGQVELMFGLFGDKIPLTLHRSTTPDPKVLDTDIFHSSFPKSKVKRLCKLCGVHHPAVQSPDTSHKS